MASTSTTVTSAVSYTDTNIVVSSASIVPSVAPVVMATQQEKPRTRSSTNSAVHSTFMRVNVSPKADGTTKISVVDLHHMVIEQHSRIDELQKSDIKLAERVESIEEKNSADAIAQEDIFRSQDERIRDIMGSVMDNRRYTESLESRVNRLEGELCKMKGTLAIREAVTDGLRSEVTRLQQFTRRYSVAVVGIDKEKDEKLDDLREIVRELVDEVQSSTTMADVDKFHRNGPQQGNKQEIIIRFKSHCAKEDFYRNRKSLTRRTVKIRPSLAHDQKILLQEAEKVVADLKDSVCINPPDYVFADLHGNIKLKLTKPSEKGMFISIKSVAQLTAVIQSANKIEVADKSHEISMNRYDSYLANVHPLPKN